MKKNFLEKRFVKLLKFKLHTGYTVEFCLESSVLRL